MMPRSPRDRNLRAPRPPLSLWGEGARAGAGRPRGGQGGITLIEVLVTVLLLAMVVGALLPLLTSGQQGSDYERRRMSMVRNGRIALDKLVREMRAAESFRTLAPGQISFTLLWGDGTGAEPTAQYLLDNVSHNLQYRWSADYDYRRQISVRAQTAVAAGYAAALTFNHAALVTAGKSLAGGDDVRVRYWNGSAMVELDRVLDPTSAWNTAATTIWFRLQVPIAANATDANYALYYGNLADATPPAYGPNVFLDYQDGTVLDGWVRRDALPGAYTPSVANGFVFQSPLGAGFRELTKNVPHGDVEIFWGFWSAAADNADGHDAGVSARVSDTGVGYRVTVADQTNATLRIRYWTGWNQLGGAIGSVAAPTAPGRNYFARFYLVGSSIRAKFWLAGTPEPAAWRLSAVDARAANGNHYGQVDGNQSPQNHHHTTMILRPRVALEPVTVLGPEIVGARPDALAALAGPFRSLSVACFDAAHAAIACAPTTPVRAVQVSLVVMDPTGAVPDITLTDQAYRQSP
jgi:type II secretory pathway pseudopilin PulG